MTSDTAHSLREERSIIKSNFENGEAENSMGYPVQINARGTTSEMEKSVETELPVKVPIVGFETMEERAKFTVFKLRVENEKLNESWLVFRRYTDFVRLHSKLKDEVQNLQISLPPKRWLRDNFETAFLDERMKGLQAFVDSILVQPELAQMSTVRRFFCLDEPPVYSDSADDSRSWSGSIEDSCVMLKHKLTERDREIQLLSAELALLSTQKDNLLKIMRHCKQCNQKAVSLNLPYIRNISNPIASPFAALPSSSSSSDHGSFNSRQISIGENYHLSPSNKIRNSPESSSIKNINLRKNEDRLNGIPEKILSSNSEKPISDEILSKKLMDSEKIEENTQLFVDPNSHESL